MATFSLKKLSDSVYRVKLSRDEIGYCRFNAGQANWTCIVTYQNKRVEKTAKDFRDAFNDVVRACNRIALCGEDSQALAVKALERRNDQVRKDVAEMNNFMHDAMSCLNMRSPIVATTRKRKIMI